MVKQLFENGVLNGNVHWTALCQVCSVRTRITRIFRHSLKITAIRWHPVLNVTSANRVMGALILSDT